MMSGRDKETMSLDDNPYHSYLKSKGGIRGVNEALDALKDSQPGTHCLMVYPDLRTLRAIYSQYTKILLEERNEIVLLLPYYETVDMVRLVLSGKNDDEDSNSNSSDKNYDNRRPLIFKNFGLDVDKYEKEGSLVIVDSLKGLSDYNSKNDRRNTMENMGLVAFLDVLEKHADKRHKDGITVLADMGSLYFEPKHDYSIKNHMKYEMSLHKRYVGKKLKGFCLYHQRDFEERFRHEQQADLLDCHSRNIMLVNAQ